MENAINFPSTLTGETITGTLIFPSEVKIKNKSLLFIHGWRSDQSGYIRRAKALADLGYICLTINLRGHGESQGDIEILTRKDFLQDAIDAFDFLAKQENVDQEKIGAVGASLGGYLPILLSAKRPLKHFAVRAPANFPDEGFDSVPLAREIEGHVRGEWMNKPLEFDETEALRNLHDYKNEALIIECEHDYTVPHQTIINFLNAAKDKEKVMHKVMRGVGHNLRNLREDDEYISLLKDWFGSRT